MAVCASRRVALSDVVSCTHDTICPEQAMKANVKINPAISDPITVQLVFGFGCVGSYEATIFDINDQNGNTFQTGASTDPSPDVVTLPAPPAQLVNRKLLIDANLTAPNPPDLVSLSAQVFQGNTPIPGASLESKAAVNAGQMATPMLFFQFTT
jgi:hypothetical protein